MYHNTTQKGVEKDKIFELRAETRTERSLGCQMTIAKKKFGRSDKPAAWRGPKPLKIAIFEAIRKKRKIEKIASKLAFFTGFGPRRAAGLAERKFFIFDIIIYHPKEHSL